jgi:hypothetical protein
VPSSDPDAGKILTTGNTVQELPPLLGPEAIGTPTVEVLADGVTLVVRDASLDPLIEDMDSFSDDVYLRTPALLRNFVLRVRSVGNPLLARDFLVVDASYEEELGGGGMVTGVELSLVTQVSGLGTLQGFIDGVLDTNPGDTLTYALIPRFFRVVTAGLPNVLPSSAFVRITFEGTAADVFGEPDEENLLVESTADITEFNSLPPGALQFFRFEVEFDLDADATGISPNTQPVTLDFLRIPFRF